MLGAVTRATGLLASKTFEKIGSESLKVTSAYTGSSKLPGKRVLPPAHGQSAAGEVAKRGRKGELRGETRRVEGRWASREGFGGSRGGF